MDERTFNKIVQWELQEDMRRAEECAVALGFMERDSDGKPILTCEGEKQFWSWFHSSEFTLH